MQSTKSRITVFHGHNLRWCAFLQGIAEELMSGSIWRSLHKNIVLSWCCTKLILFGGKTKMFWVRFSGPIWSVSSRGSAHFASLPPPCSTYSRARHLYKRFPGPRPIRSRQHPGGFPWLPNGKRVKAQQGTALATKAWELCDLAGEVGARYLIPSPY